MRATTNEQLRQQAVAGYVLRQLSKWTPFYFMFLLPLFALLLKAFERGKRMPYMHHFAHAVHINTVALLLFIPASFWILETLGPGVGGTGKFAEVLATIFLRCCCIFICLFRCVWFIETVGAKQ